MGATGTRWRQRAEWLHRLGVSLPTLSSFAGSEDAEGMLAPWDPFLSHPPGTRRRAQDVKSVLTVVPLLDYSPRLCRSLSDRGNHRRRPFPEVHGPQSLRTPLPLSIAHP